MIRINEDEWGQVQGALVRGGLRATIDALINERIDKYLATTPVKDQMFLSDANLNLLFRAYDDGMGNTLSLRYPEDASDGYFVGVYEDHDVMEGVEIDGVLYSIVPMSGGGQVAVLVGAELTEAQDYSGVTFHTTAEAKAYIRGLTAK